MNETEKTPAQEASATAVTAAKVAAKAVEVSREAQLAEAVEKTAVQTKRALLEGLKEIFAGPDESDPEHMSIIYSKIPLLCLQVKAMQNDISGINSNIKWAVRLILGALILAGIKLLIHK